MYLNINQICQKFHVIRWTCKKALQRGCLIGEKYKGEWLVEEKDAARYFREMHHEKWISQADVIDFFKVNNATLQMLRDTTEIVWKKHKGKIFYAKISLMAYLISLGCDRLKPKQFPKGSGISRKIIIKNSKGIHFRPTIELCLICKEFYPNTTLILYHFRGPIPYEPSQDDTASWEYHPNENSASKLLQLEIHKDSDIEIRVSGERPRILADRAEKSLNQEFG